jgi:hypothetical protein
MDKYGVEVVEETLKKFRLEVVMTVEQIATSLNKSIPTARYRLKQWHVLTSYDKNGRYYVLPSIPKFNSYGLWSYNNIHFSKYGNLKNTLINLVENSSSGIDGTGIGKLLGLDPRSFLSHFGKLSGLRREKFSGRFFYFASAENKFKNQLSERNNFLFDAVDSSLPDSIGIVVLVEKIKYPKIGLEKLTKRLQNKGQPVTMKKIQDFFLHHGIQKKTSD